MAGKQVLPGGEGRRVIISADGSKDFLPFDGKTQAELAPPISGRFGLGSGGASAAARKLSGRGRQIDDAVEGNFGSSVRNEDGTLKRPNQ